MTFTAHKRLITIFQENLVFTKTKEIWDGLDDSDAIMMQTVVDRVRIIKFATAIMDDFTVRCEALYEGSITQLKRSIVNS